MKPFDLEEAKQGKPICTRDGAKARILATDLKYPQYHVVAAVWNNTEKREDVTRYTDNGEFLPGETYSVDLMMVEDEEQPKCPFKPFDKVLVRDRDTDKMKWQCTLFSHYDDDYMRHNFVCVDDFYAQCIPYNEETEHLIGTTDAPPEKYVIW